MQFHHLIRVFSFCIILYYASNPLAGHAQSARGVVVDSATGKPLPGASVFIASSTIGTTTDDNGEYVLTHIPFSRYELVISYIGYQTKSLQQASGDSSQRTIPLSPASEALNAVLVTNYEKDGWQHWGFLFRNTFLGTAPIGDNCIIKNPKDLRFSFSQSDRVLHVVAVNPIKIINKRLGYEIAYDLVEYQNDFENNTLVSTGYAYFKKLKGSQRKQTLWQRNRREAFEGSLMQFMRAVYAHTLEKTGFEVRKLIRKPNLEKQRIKLLTDALKENPQALPADSTAYYRKILAQNDAVDVLYSGLLPIEQFCFGPANGTAQLLFKDYLQITYCSKKPPRQYQAVAGYDSCITALLTMTKHEPVSVTALGGFFDPLNIMVGQYWAWSEKIGSMLPLDYMP